LLAIVSWLLVLAGFFEAVIYDPFFRYFIWPILFLITVYHFLSFGINIAYRRFNLIKHQQIVRDYWSKQSEPSVDIFLPICGEELSVLDNTWSYVSQLKYKNKKVYVLDDSKDDTQLHGEMAKYYGFTYLARPNRREMKKAGNLKYAYERTDGDFIAIFDADFSPHEDFLIEMIPYTAAKNVGIVQSPQYFHASKITWKFSWVSYCAAYQEEFFYRITQVARDRFDAAICCGSNAVYRRAALEVIGGPKQVDASEDSRTGFALLEKGWVTRYIPVILAIGICPDNIYAYFHQQHRWCRGRSLLVLSREFITAKVGLMKKLCNISGFLAFLIRPFELLMTFQLFWVVFFYNDYIPLGSSVIFWPYIFFSLILLPYLHLVRFTPRVFLMAVLQIFISTHSLANVLFGKSVGWIATNSKHTLISSAFKQTTFMVYLFLLIYLTMLFLALDWDLVHVGDFKYYSVQFWIFWNLLLISLILIYLYGTMYVMKKNSFLENIISRKEFLTWFLKTGAFFYLLTFVTIGCIVHLL